MPAHDLALLTDAARAAGRIAMHHWKRDPQVWDKGGEHGPVTEADLAVNDMLQTTLRTARPDYGWLSEETTDTPDRLTRDRVFIIDPIDGTRAFIAGEETFAHSLAIATHGTITAAVVYLPALDKLYTATTTALKDGQPITASPRTTLTGADILTTKANLDPARWPGGVPDIHRSFRASLAYRLCLAAEGKHDGMLTLRDTWEWDIAAGSLIAQRAGCRVTDQTGADITFNSPGAKAKGILALPNALHGTALRLLQQTT